MIRIDRRTNIHQDYNNAPTQDSSGPSRLWLLFPIVGWIIFAFGMAFSQPKVTTMEYQGRVQPEAPKTKTISTVETVATRRKKAAQSATKKAAPAVSNHQEKAIVLKKRYVSVFAELKSAKRMSAEVLEKARALISDTEIFLADSSIPTSIRGDLTSKMRELNTRVDALVTLITKEDIGFLHNELIQISREIPNIKNQHHFDLTFTVIDKYLHIIKQKEHISGIRELRERLVQVMAKLETRRQELSLVEKKPSRSSKTSKVNQKLKREKSRLATAPTAHASTSTSPMTMTMRTKYKNVLTGAQITPELIKAYETDFSKVPLHQRGELIQYTLKINKAKQS